MRRFSIDVLIELVECVMVCTEQSGSMSRCRERSRNAIFSATIWLKKRHFRSWYGSEWRPTGSHHHRCIAEDHSLTRCGAHVPYPLPSAARISKIAQSGVLLQFHARAQTPTSQHFIRMHSLLSLIRNLKQVRRSLRSRDRNSEFRLRMAIFGLFLILSRQQVTQ